VFTPKINRVEEYNLGKNRALVDQYVLLGFARKAEYGEELRHALSGEEEIDHTRLLC